MLFTDEMRALYAADNCLVIGDGSRNLTEDEVKTQLEGKVDSDTRFDVYGHGAVEEATKNIK